MAMMVVAMRGGVVVFRMLFLADGKYGTHHKVSRLASTMLSNGSVI